jgi:hypothetical protein
MGSSKLAIGFAIFVFVFAMVTVIINSTITGTDSGSTLLKAIGPIALVMAGVGALLFGLLKMFSGGKHSSRY